MALGLSCAALSARAQDALDQRFDEGFALNRFEPAPAGDRFFSVNDASSSDHPSPVRAMLLGHYTLKPTIVRRDADTGERREVVSSQLYAHLDASVLPLPWLLVNADLPLAVSQTGEGPAAPDSPTLADLRLGARARLLGSEHAPFSLAPAVDVWVPTGSEDELTGDGSVRVLPKLLVSGRAGAFIYAANGGFVVREYLDTGSLELGNSLTYGAGVGLLLFDDKLQLSAELNGAGFLASEKGDDFAASTSPLELLFGVKFRAGPMVFGGGLGPGLSDAPGTAPRAVLSVAYAPATKRPLPAPDAEAALAPEPAGAGDRDGDGIPDGADACPDQAGAENAVASMHGCPAASLAQPAAAPPADRDGDGVADDRDACPDHAGEVSDDPSRSGCPAGPLDSDEDGLADEKDACPREASSTAEGSPKNGCPGTGPAEATFAGFRPAPSGASTVFVQLTDSVKVEVTEGKGEVSYLMRGARVGIRNNRNPLLASEFEAAVARAQLVSDKDGVRLVLRLKAAVKPTYRVVRHGHGAELRVDVPPPPAAETTR